MADNKLLEDLEYIRKLDFPDIYYLETLFYKISAFLKNVPVPMSSEYKNRKLVLAIGSDVKEFEIDVDISYYDMITLIKMWSEKYYPQYIIKNEVEIPLSEEEIIEKLKDKTADINDVLNETKLVTKIEKGIIEKVFIKTDQFLFKKNNSIREIRMSGTLEHPLPLSFFMKELRKFKNESKEEKNIHIYDYIKNNSKVIKIIENDLKEIPISYSGKQLYNFFIINYNNLKDQELKRIDDFHYLWGNFKIKFESITLKSDCLSFYERMKEKESQ